jgi:hypothetical protein
MMLFGKGSRTNWPFTVLVVGIKDLPSVVGLREIAAQFPFRGIAPQLLSGGHVAFP